MAATRRLIASLEQQKKQDLEARRKAAAANPARFSGSTNPVFQQLKISLADAEANVAALRARLSEGEARLAQLKSVRGPLATGRDRDGAIDARLRRACARTTSNWSRGASRPRSRRTSTAPRGMAEFRIIEPPRISPKAVFPNRLALVPLVLALALAAGAAVALAVSQILPVFYDARQVRAATKRAVLGTVSLQPTPPIIHRRRKVELRVRRRRGEPGHAVRQLDRLGRAGRARLRSQREHHRTSREATRATATGRGRRRRAPLAAGTGCARSTRRGDAVPLRVIKELEARTGPADAAERGHRRGARCRQRAGRAASVGAEKRRQVEIDLARLSAGGFVTPHSPRSRLAEEFRVIKRPLLNNISGKSAAPVRHANRIMVTSSVPGEGKTFVSLNLAMSLAMELDTEVLLVDADASRPALLERLGLAPSKGLLDLLVEPGLSVNAVMLETNVPNLSVLPAGSPQAHATELLASANMSRLVEQLAMDDPRRIVLFDTPPLLVASEARVLAAHMGQVIMVIAADDTPQATVAEALATIENCPVVFNVLNRVSQSDRSPLLRVVRCVRGHRQLIRDRGSWPCVHDKCRPGPSAR